MKKRNLYELLGVRPDDDAENLRMALRKASPPSHHGGDQDAAARFRQTVDNILRDAERAAYERVREFQPKPRRAKPNRVISELRHHLLHDAIAAVVLATVLAGGYTIFVRVSETPVVQAAGLPGSESEGTFAVQTAQRNGAERDNLDRVAVPLPIAPHAVQSDPDNPGGASEITADKPVPAQAEQRIDVAGRDGHPGVIDHASAAAAGVDDPGKREGGQPADRHEAQSADVALSALRGDDFTPNASSFGGKLFDEKHGNKSSEPGGGNADDAKRPEIKVSARPSTAVKKRTASRLPFKQALLENRNVSACAGSQSCSGGAPHLFGIGP